MYTRDPRNRTQRPARASAGVTSYLSNLKVILDRDSPGGSVGGIAAAI